MGTLSAVKNRQSAICGEVRTMPINSVPTGWLSCDGSAVSRTTYAKLFSVIGTTYGVGDGSTTFNLPNYNSGKFLRGVGGNSAAIGTSQANATKKNGLSASAENSSVTGSVTINNSDHNHSANAGNGSSAGTVRVAGSAGGSIGAMTLDTTATPGRHTHTNSFSLTAGAQAITIGNGDVETRPDNYAVLFVIRY